MSNSWRKAVVTGEVLKSFEVVLVVQQILFTRRPRRSTPLPGVRRWARVKEVVGP